MKVILTRDSVAMGDDVDAPHEQRREFPDGLAAVEVITAVVADGYLPPIAGGRAVWVVVSGADRSLAVVAQEWAEPRPLTDGWGDALPDEGSPVRLHFRYLAQEDPEAVHGRLRAKS
ncbi:hypothetical protein ACFY1P_08910 [Streptomyces sp. NPDC001407]|uniref:hypothetical protein n=1 Tax=Streptomyces sp. NPDC001407 TaxID=3364573 RepID=UPI0036BC90B6